MKMKKTGDRFSLTAALVLSLLTMAEKFNALVIGAGLGGLCAAARLRREGLKVLVLERAPHHGGTSHVFHRRGYDFPMGPLGFSSPALVKRRLEELGARSDLEFSRVDYRVRAFGLDLPLSLPFESMKKEYGAAFPLEAEAVSRFFDDMASIAAAMKNPEKADAIGLATRAASTSAFDYVEELFEDARLKMTLGGMGADEPYSSQALLAAMFHLMCEVGVWFPQGGVRTIGDRLAEVVSSREGDGKGEIRLGSEVIEVLIEDGVARGVALADGTKIDADFVVSNADYKSTFLKLVFPEFVPEEFFMEVFNSRQTSSNLQVSLGLDPAKADLGAFKRAQRIVYRRGGMPPFAEPDWRSLEINPRDLAGQSMEIALWSAHDASVAPEGKAAVVIRVEADYPHFTRYRPGRGKRVDSYLEYKTRLGKALVEEAENLIPGLGAAVEFMDVATPLTFEERGGRSGGAVAGWSWNFEDNKDFQAREMIRTPLHRLYMAGYQAYSSLFMGGVPMAMESGIKAAELAMDGSGPG